MAYQTGSAATLDELMAKFLTLAEGLGFSVATNKALNSWYLNNAEGYWSFQTESDRRDLLCCYVNTDVNVGNPGSAQPGSSYANNINRYQTASLGLNHGGYAGYHLFGTARYIHCVVQLDNDQFCHFGVGSLNKIGNYLGGQYCYGTFAPYLDAISIENGAAFNGNYRGYPAVVRVEGLGGDTRSPWYLVANYGNGYDENKYSDAFYGGLFFANCYIGTRWWEATHPETALLYFSHSQFGNLIVPTVNNLLAVGRDKIIRQIGSPPDFYEVRAKGVVPGQEFEVAGSRWKIFPAIRYGASAASEFVCHAYRLVP